MAESLRNTMSSYPVEFRGCMWDAGWEFDAPTVIYYPFFRFGFGGNTFHLDHVVEDLCIDYAIGRPPNVASMKEELRRECKWRGWSLRYIAGRKQSWHCRFLVRWYMTNGECRFDVYERHEQWGPFTNVH